MVPVLGVYIVPESVTTVLFPFEKDGHYNKLGYKKVAETIYKLTL